MNVKERYAYASLYTGIFMYIAFNLVLSKPPLSILIIGLSIILMILLLGVVEPLLVLMRDEYTEEYTNRTSWYGRRTPVFLRSIPANYAGMSIGFLPKLKFIVLNREALEKMDEKCKKALLAHEMGHIMYNHMAKHVLLGIFLISLSVVIPVLLGLIPSIIYILLIPVILIRSVRKHEQEATGYAILYVGHESYDTFIVRLRELIEVRGITGFLYMLTHDHPE